MKSFYFVAASVLAMCSFSNEASAQYTGGTYTAVRDGNWHDVGPAQVWDVSGEPPARCVSCHIIIGDGFTVTMNADVTLSGHSFLEIGTDPNIATTLKITFSNPNPPATPFPVPSTYHRINMLVGDATSIKVLSGLSKIDASTTGQYDGVFMAVPTNGGTSEFFYNARIGTTAQYQNATSLNGPSTLSSTGTLPIFLSEFKAVSAGKNQVDLAWTTNLEINSDHFAVQRSSDGGAHWETIGNVTAKGNSSQQANYSFTDLNGVAGVSQYRLQSIDRDAHYAFSNIKVIRTNLVSGVSVFPNPARDYVNVNLGLSGDAGSSLNVRLLNQSGQILVEKKLNNAAGTILSLPVSSYPQGNYLILVTGADGSQHATKLLISKQ